jgi:hypothetical protein
MAMPSEVPPSEGIRSQRNGKNVEMHLGCHWVKPTLNTPQNRVRAPECEMQLTFIGKTSPRRTSMST